MKTTLPPGDLLKLLAVTVIWGTNVVAVKYSTADLPPFLVAGLRFLFVAILLCPFNPIDLNQLRRLSPAAALLGLGHFGLLFVGLASVDAASGSVFIQMGAPFSVLLAWAVFGEAPGIKRLIGLGLALSGVALLAGAPGHADLIPILCLLASELAWAIATLRIKLVAQGLAPMALNAWLAAIAAPLLLTASGLTESGQWAVIGAAHWSCWGGLAFTVIGSSVIGYGLWYRLLIHHPIGDVVPYTLVCPVYAFAAGYWLLNESITLAKVVGAVLTIVGIAIIEIKGSQKLQAVEVTP